MGVDIATGEKRFRKVIRLQREACFDWYIVDGRMLTACEPVFCEEKMSWVPAHEVGMAKFSHFGYKISMIVEGEKEDDHNFVLMPFVEGQSELIVHNGILPRS